ncbi:hypothetical protein [Tenacibaculum sp. 47A_GOM-205m]|uniref:hypothetical protein n=1 Tax=Tenacibaculum sp. 47A_GOM-205m TaxID=1380384 RepID=UPI00048B70DF|nr:hypothetical protein [Tenacibaculum sp. 47A_GOM-205m]
MNTLQLLAYLQRVYDQKQALLKKRNSPEYREDVYNRLMGYYDEKIPELRTRVEKQDAEALAKFDADRANEVTITEGIEYVSCG